MFQIDRRVFLSASAGCALALGPSGALAQSVDPDELHAPGQLGEKALGSPDAPVTVVEYASFTCPHCATFHNDVFGDFALKYIDSGKVRFIMREYLRNGPDVAVSAVARCAPGDRYFDVIDLYFATQQEWSRASDLRQAILDKAIELGFTEESFDACLSNTALFEAFDANMTRAASFGVTGTPTFFVNGEKHVGALPLSEWDAIIEPLLAAAGH